MSDEQKCSVDVWRGWSFGRCSRKAVRDGFCKQHHPDSVEERREKSAKDYERKRNQSTYAQLFRARGKIADLESELTEARRERDEERGRVCRWTKKLFVSGEEHWATGCNHEEGENPEDGSFCRKCGGKVEVGG